MVFTQGIKLRRVEDEQGRMAAHSFTAGLDSSKYASLTPTNLKIVTHVIGSLVHSAAFHSSVPFYLTAISLRVLEIRPHTQNPKGLVYSIGILKIKRFQDLRLGFIEQGLIYSKTIVSELRDNPQNQNLKPKALKPKTLKPKPKTINPKPYSINVILTGKYINCRTNSAECFLRSKA